MATCAFFGHSEYSYSSNEKKIENAILELIESGVCCFYSGYRGNFDTLCCEIVKKLKAEFPQIRLTMALSYHPNEEFWLPPCFDDSVYLLERKVPPQYAIVETNKLLVKKADVILSGVVFPFGGAYNAVTYAKKHGKDVREIAIEEEEDEKDRSKT